PTSPVLPSPVVSSPPTGKSCTAEYSIVGQWPGGFQGEVRVTARGAGLAGWTVSWQVGSGQAISQSWNATVSAGGVGYTARNMPYNGNLGPGASTSFGFIGSWTGVNSVPALSCTAQ
ncbi:MAG TPA: cellulose binding domain-containing protein, partial [Actinoplanes sp.]|nr:cellulose binding domain-containing protein [Actinoplanes sp.]